MLASGARGAHEDSCTSASDNDSIGSSFIWSYASMIWSTDVSGARSSGSS